jgi:HAD superfamily hydrolase (TIGR01490 family)
VSSSAEVRRRPAAAFFDLDKTIIAKSSTLAYGPSFYRNGLISRGDAVRGAVAQLLFARHGASHDRMEQIRERVSQRCRGWPADRVQQIVARHLDELIVPYVYDEARALLDAHRAAGEDVIIVSTSGVELVGPIGTLLGAALVIGTQMEIADGRYTGQMDFYAYGPAKADRVRELAGERGYRLADCSAYSDSITDLPMLEAVGHPHAVNPDRALRRLAQLRGWPVLAFSALPRPASGAAGRYRPPVRRRPGAGAGTTQEEAGDGATQEEAGDGAAQEGAGEGAAQEWDTGERSR